MIGASRVITVVMALSPALTACGAGRSVGHSRGAAAVSGRPAGRSPRAATVPGRSHPGTRPVHSAATPSVPQAVAARSPQTLPPPRRLAVFMASPAGGQGIGRPAGRRVGGVAAVYETTLVPPAGSRPAGIAWMDTRRLVARLYSGSKSPGGGPFRYTAPIRASSARHLVAAFNGGFMPDAAGGGYYTEGRLIKPLRAGAASLVIHADGSATVGAWGRDVRMTRDVVAVRQNLVPLVADGRPARRAAGADWRVWGSTCGARSCAASVPGIEHQWRSALGVTSDGALIYVQGAELAPRQLAELLVRAGTIRGMELDINPDWPVFATYDPNHANGLAEPANGRLLTATVRGPGTFFESWWARDFITMSTR
ncbi:MAG TPA: hypothetical protein VFN55_11765 [Solirubrobacteraceae bacterium]|nr:hypothetical protein [Solirubrobacteraceae bacterium]